MGRAFQDEGSSPLRSGGEVARAKPETERMTTARRAPASISRARDLRRGDNIAETMLWNELKARKLGDHKFVRQMPCGPYFADLACRSFRLIVEVDGSQHAGSNHDRRRDRFLLEEGYSVLRFWNIDVLKHRTSVCETILAAVEGRLEAMDNHEVRYVKAVRE
jgi:very-short-patch-repair endonuclease